MNAVYTIQSAEHYRLAYDPKIKGDYRHREHAYLLLMRQYLDERPECLDQLHFMPRDIGKNQKVFWAITTHGWPVNSEPRRIVDKITHHETQSEAKALAMWEKALVAAYDLDFKNIPFINTSPNCQTGVRTVLDILSLEFNPKGQSAHQIRGGDITMVHEVDEALKGELRFNRTAEQINASIEFLKESHHLQKLSASQQADRASPLIVLPLPAMGC